uniref:Reticulocyte-binding protein 2 homolog a-like n=1 Tax=Saccoglossus kowalevskii TaxID=10224 RepID=A0ABM0MY94_SACKO|nr:PREDICTED: reticulocyte-binding protein 2 homolog a-like [Saccoglossus kowalevskii]
MDVHNMWFFTLGRGWIWFATQEKRWYFMVWCPRKKLVIVSHPGKKSYHMSWCPWKRLDELQKQLNFYEKHNAVLTDQLSTLRKHSMQVDALNSKFDKALVQVEELRKENERLHTENAGLKADVEKLQTYEGRCEILSIELKDANQKNKELKFKASKLEKELATATSASQDSCLDKDKLKKRLLQLNLETEAQSKKGELQHQQLKDFQSQLMEKDAQLRVEQEERERLLVLVDTLNEELRRTRDLLDHRQQEQPPIIEKQSFKEYIRMKREMVSLREENNMLKGRKSKHHALPRLKIESPETRFHSTNGSAESKDRTQVYTKAHAPVSYTFNPLSKK